MRATNSGRVPGINAPMCAAGANFMPVTPIKMNGAPAPQHRKNRLAQPARSTAARPRHSTGQRNSDGTAKRKKATS